MVINRIARRGERVSVEKAEAGIRRKISGNLHLFKTAAARVLLRM